LSKKNETIDDGSLGLGRSDSAEAKRRDARRRILLGGSAAVLSIVTVDRARAGVGISTCLSQLGINWNLQGFSIDIDNCYFGGDLSGE